MFEVGKVFLFLFDYTKNYVKIFINYIYKKHQKDT